MSNKTLFIVLAALVLVIAGGAITYNKTSDNTGKVGIYDSFAQCLANNGAIFYGAFWCPHCQNQKKAFGSAAQYLPYIECATPNGQGQTPVCVDAKVTSYPTWVFANGEVATGEVSMERLAELSECTLPAVIN